MQIADYEREHPIPQDISAYQFRLVGDMTIKQFMQVAAGALISLLIYSSNIPPYVKWPLIILSFLSGIALAFFPIQDRPLAKWISLFLKAIYSPTVYRWQSGVQIVNLFQDEPQTVTGKVPGAKLPSPGQKQAVVPGQKITESSTEPSEIPVPLKEKDEADLLDESEAQFLHKVNRAFAEEPAEVDIEKKIEEMFWKMGNDPGWIVNVGQGLAPVNLGFARAEHVEIRPIEDQNGGIHVRALARPADCDR